MIASKCTKCGQNPEIDFEFEGEPGLILIWCCGFGVSSDDILDAIARWNGKGAGSPKPSPETDRCKEVRGDKQARMLR